MTAVGAEDIARSPHFDFDAAVKVEEVVDCVVIVAHCADATDHEVGVTRETVT